MRFEFGLGILSVLMATSGVAVGGAHDDILAAARADRTEEVVSYLQKGMDPNTSDAAGTTLLMTAAANGNVALVEILLRLRANTMIRNKFNESALALAALNGQNEIVRMLVETGVRIDAPGWGALHYAVFNGHTDLVRYLIDRGGNVNVRAPNRHTPLMLAARNGHGEIARILLAAGANPNLGDLEGSTALEIAQRAGNHQIADLLRTLAPAGR
jgi:ankyrin repeat protein